MKVEIVLTKGDEKKHSVVYNGECADGTKQSIYLMKANGLKAKKIRMTLEEIDE